MENKITLPIGMSNFTEIRKNHYYYIDKTGLVENLLQNNLSKGTLITRPRRFGKTLAMCMLADFFDIRKNSRALFDGLYIAGNKSLCAEWMNQCPVIFLTLKILMVSNLNLCIFRSKWLFRNYPFWLF